MSIIVGIIGLLLAVGAVLMKIKGNMSVSIIGGADGPTSIFVAGKVGGDFSTILLIIGIIILFLGGVVFFKSKH